MKFRHAFHAGRDSLHIVFADGEGLPLHGHEPETYHDTLVLSGQVEVFGPGWSETLQAGDRRVFTDAQMTHAIYAFGDTEILNIYRQPKPDLAKLTEWRTA